MAFPGCLKQVSYDQPQKDQRDSDRNVRLQKSQAKNQERDQQVKQADPFNPICGNGQVRGMQFLLLCVDVTMNIFFNTAKYTTVG